MRSLRNLSRGILLCVLMSSLPLRAQEITLLMVPRDDGPVRIGMDVGNRYPTILLSYQAMPNGSYSLHGWTGNEWVNVTLESFRKGTFFPHEPSSAMIIETKAVPLPEALLPPEEWCPAVYRIKTVETRPLLHLLGRHYDFKYRDWKWFADNYKMPMEQINPDDLNLAWYHKRLSDNLQRDPNQGRRDIQLLEVVREAKTDLDAPEPLPAEDLDDEIIEAGPASGNEIMENPFTNPVPKAAIVTGDDAEEGPIPEAEGAGAETETSNQER